MAFWELGPGPWQLHLCAFIFMTPKHLDEGKRWVNLPVYLVTDIKSFPEQGHDSKPRAWEAGKMSGQKTMLLLPHSQGRGRSRRGVACTLHLFAKPPSPSDTLTPVICAHFQTEADFEFPE